MGNSSSSGYGHSFLDFFKSAGDFFKATAGTLFEGDTSGWSNFSNDWKNYGQDVAQTFTNKAFNRFGGAGLAVDQSFLSSGSRIQATSGTTQGTSPATIVAPSSSRSVNATYSSGGLGGTTKPSSLNAISDPTTKMAIATSRGSQRAQVNNVNNQQDLAASQSLATASSAPSATPP